VSGGLRPLFWALFAAGGMVAALFYPVHVLVTGVLAPAGVVEAPPHDRIHGVVTHPLFRLYLAVFFVLPLFHAAHRVKAAFMDFGLRPWARPTALLLYGAALALSAWAVWTVATA
jgi:fumarate reductase subunit D